MALSSRNIGKALLAIALLLVGGVGLGMSLCSGTLALTGLMSMHSGESAGLCAGVLAFGWILMKVSLTRFRNLVHGDNKAAPSAFSPVELLRVALGGALALVVVGAFFALLAGLHKGQSSLMGAATLALLFSVVATVALLEWRSAELTDEANAGETCEDCAAENEDGDSRP